MEKRYMVDYFMLMGRFVGRGFVEVLASDSMEACSMCLDSCPTAVIYEVIERFDSNRLERVFRFDDAYQLCLNSTAVK